MIFILDTRLLFTCHPLTTPTPRVNVNITRSVGFRFNGPENYGIETHIDFVYMLRPSRPMAVGMNLGMSVSISSQKSIDSALILAVYNYFYKSPISIFQTLRFTGVSLLTSEILKTTKIGYFKIIFVTLFSAV